MYLKKEKGNEGHVFFFKNSDPMEVHYNFPELRFKALGGIIHIKLFIGTSMDDALEKYHDYLGKYIVPPFWSMGFHQCRWGYRSADALEEVVSNYRKNKLPIDVIWSDIDYMDDH